MADHNPHKPEERQEPRRQTGEEEGRIKRAQQTDATMAEKDLPRGSERETHNQK